jgi:hypothetical protein
MRNLLLTVHQHGGDDVTCKPRISIILLQLTFVSGHLRFSSMWSLTRVVAHRGSTEWWSMMVRFDIGSLSMHVNSLQYYWKWNTVSSLKIGRYNDSREGSYVGWQNIRILFPLGIEFIPIFKYCGIVPPIQHGCCHVIVQNLYCWSQFEWRQSTKKQY